MRAKKKFAPYCTLVSIFVCVRVHLVANTWTSWFPPSFHRRRRRRPVGIRSGYLCFLIYMKIQVNPFFFFYFFIRFATPSPAALFQWYAAHHTYILLCIYTWHQQTVCECVYRYRALLIYYYYYYHYLSLYFSKEIKPFEPLQKLWVITHIFFLLSEKTNNDTKCAETAQKTGWQKLPDYIAPSVLTGGSFVYDNGIRFRFRHSNVECLLHYLFH